MGEVMTSNSTESIKSFDIPDWWGGVVELFKSEAELAVDHNRLPMFKKEKFTENVEFIERYEINEYADAVILYNNTYDEYIYYVDEPDLREYEAVLKETKLELDDRITHRTEEIPVIPEDPVEKSELYRNEARRYLDNQKGTEIQNRIFELLSSISPSFARFKKEMSEEMKEKVLYYIERDLVLMGDIQPLIEDDEHIEDIHVPRPNVPVHVYHEKYGQGGNIMTSVEFDDEGLDALVQQLIQQAGQTVSSADPIGDGSLEDGSRINVNLGDEITDGGANVTIRLFDDDPLTPPDLVKYGTFNLNQLAYIWLAVENEKSIMFVGGTAAGKTTSLNAASMFIPLKFKMVSIEDTREVELPNYNWLKKVTREGVGDADEIGFDELLKDALRQRPDYIMMGEVRGEEAERLFEGMNTGHASLSTFHANSPVSAVNRLSENLKVSKQQMRALDLISVQSKYNRDGKDIRRIDSIGEIVDVNDRNNVEIVRSYRYNPEPDDYEKMYEGTESNLLDEIATKNVMTEEELIDEIKDRETVIQQMVKESISDYERVSYVIQTYMKNKSKVMNAVKGNQLDELVSNVIDD